MTHALAIDIAPEVAATLRPGRQPMTLQGCPYTLRTRSRLADGRTRLFLDPDGPSLPPILAEAKRRVAKALG